MGGMKRPMPEMKHKPFGADYMFGAWLSLVMSAFDDKETRDNFESDTGINIYDIVTAKGINGMIDKSTGRQKEAIVKWLDWVTLYIWGIDGKKQCC